MKKRNLKRKLNLNKSKISSLSKNELRQVKGGTDPLAVSIHVCSYVSEFFCELMIPDDPTDSLTCYLDSCGCPSVIDAC